MFVRQVSVVFWLSQWNRHQAVTTLR